jgi:hypothetical protein
VTVDPGATEAAMGSNMKFEMVTVCVVVAPAALRDGDDVVGADDPELPPPHAASSRAAAMTVTTAPLLTPRTGSRIRGPGRSG